VQVVHLALLLLCFPLDIKIVDVDVMPLFEQFEPLKDFDLRGFVEFGLEVELLEPEEFPFLEQTS